MAARRPRLDRRLDEQVQRALEGDQIARMGEGLVCVSLNQAAHEPVGQNAAPKSDTCRSASSQPCGSRPGACRRRARATIEKEA